MYDCHEDEFDLYSIETGKPFKVYYSRDDIGEKNEISSLSHILCNDKLQMDLRLWKIKLLEENVGQYLNGLMAR